MNEESSDEALAYDYKINNKFNCSHFNIFNLRVPFRHHLFICGVAAYQPRSCGSLYYCDQSIKKSRWAWLCARFCNCLDRNQLQWKRKQYLTWGIYIFDDDQGKRFRDHALGVHNWNVCFLNWKDAAAKLVNVPRKLAAHIIAVHATRFTAQGQKRYASQRPYKVIQISVAERLSRRALVYIIIEKFSLLGEIYPNGMTLTVFERA